MIKPKYKDNMTQEEKDLLLKDLCARLPYQPMCEFTDTEDDFCTATAALGYSLRDFIAGKVLIKPILRPMSSMTEEEKENLKQEHIKDEKLYVECITKAKNGDNSMRGKVVLHFAADWCNKNHFDYRGLIPKGLALEAKEGMYIIKTKK